MYVCENSIMMLCNTRGALVVFTPCRKILAKSFQLYLTVFGVLNLRIMFFKLNLNLLFKMEQGLNPFVMAWQTIINRKEVVVK